MSILNLFSPAPNHEIRCKPAPRLALSAFVHFFNPQQMLKMLKFSGKILAPKTTTMPRNCRRGFLASILQYFLTSPLTKGERRGVVCRSYVSRFGDRSYGGGVNSGRREFRFPTIMRPNSECDSLQVLKTSGLPIVGHHHRDNQTKKEHRFLLGIRGAVCVW